MLVASPAFFRASALLLSALMLASCSGHGTSPVLPQHLLPTTVASAESNFPVATAPQPYDAQTSTAIERTQLNTDVNLPFRADFTQRRLGRRPMSVAGPNDHEDTGVGFNESGRYTSLFAIHQVHPGLQLVNPPGQTGTSFFYAPTTKDGCFENTTAYETNPSGTTGFLGVFDWCNAFAFVAGVFIDQSFTRLYVRKVAGIAVFATEIYTADLHPHAGSKWYSLIYNFVTHRWDQLAELAEEPSTPPFGGWSIFEFYLLPGPCPVLPTTSVGALSLFDTQLHRWRLITPELPDLQGNVSPGPPGSCFVDNSPEGAMYTMQAVLPYYYWRVGTT